MKNVLNLFRFAPKRTSLVAAVLTAALVPAALFAWGPDRPTYTIEKPAPHVTFNSITNNPAHGDERNFMQVKAADAPNSAYAESVDLTAGKEYEVYIYFHNDAASNLNDSGKGIATGAKVRAEIPAVVKGSTKSNGFVSADNAQPKVVFDDITFKSKNDVALRFVPNSATITSAGKVNGQKLPDSIITTGAPIGYDALNGKVPGCNEFSGYVTFKVKADQPNFTVKKQVRMNGTKEWSENVVAKAGDTVDYNIEYKNTGTTWQNNVVIRDVLPAGMTYVDGSTMFANKSQPKGAKASDNVTKSGINVGNYAPGANVFVKFSATLNQNDDLPTCGKNTLRNIARAETNNGTKEDDATVEVEKTCEVKEEECKPGIPVGDKRCEDTPVVVTQPKTPETPAELPQTGPVSLIGGLIGTGALSAGAYYWVNSRRALRDSLLR